MSESALRKEEAIQWLKVRESQSLMSRGKFLVTEKSPEISPCPRPGMYSRRPGEVLIPRENQDIRVACQPGKSKLLVNESNIVHGADDLLRKRVEFVVRIYCGEEFTMMGGGGCDDAWKDRRRFHPLFVRH